MLFTAVSWSGGNVFSQNNAQNRTERESTEPAPELRSAPNTIDEVTPLPLPPPGNDACASATTLTVGAACITGTTDQASTQGGEYLCINPGGGITPETVWYRFTASNDSLVLGIVLTNTSNCATVLAVYGPFAPGGGCLPGAGSQLMCQNMALIDPGFHPLLTGLTIGQQYLVQVQGNNCGGGNDRFANFCISVSNPDASAFAGSAPIINNCGVAFTGNTRGGNFANGTSIGNNNLDNNNATQVAGASEVGDDVTFVINNVSWFTFCNGNASACNWSVLVNNINGCLLSALNAGIQAAVFSGSPAALTNVAISPSRIAPGSSWSSGTFSVAAGACAYIMVDGFAGDECNYDLTLTNVSCPCLVLPVNLYYMAGMDYVDHVLVNWAVNADVQVTHFLIESSADGITFSAPRTVNAEAGASATHRYSFVDGNPTKGWNYYRLTAVDLNGTQHLLNTMQVMHRGENQLEVTLEGQNLNVKFTSGLSGPLTLELTDVSGKQVMRTEVNVQRGLNEFTLDLGHLGAGMYAASVNGSDIKEVKRFVKP